MSRTYIIAEAGVNHNGNEALAFQLIDAACEAGANAVKFQTFKAKNLVTKDAQQCSYQQTNTGIIESQYEMLSRLELSYDVHHSLVAYCKKLGIEFLSTAFDFESLYFLVNDLKLRTLKIASGEITNAPLLLAHAQSGCDLIVSTGMASLAEIEAALGVIAFGYLDSKNTLPSFNEFQSAYLSDEGQRMLKQKVTLLHCTTEYPAPYEDINLLAMDTMRSAFSLSVGYSDHSQGICIPIAAVARGATCIEKHFTLDKQLPGPDHKASLDPSELREMCESIRYIEQALGNGLKGPRPSEHKNKGHVRKSIIASQEIKLGENFSTENIVIKRPGHGLSPYRYWEMLTTAATKHYHVGELIDE